MEDGRQDQTERYAQEKTNREGRIKGASYLFLVNCYFIFLAAAIVLSIRKIPRGRELTGKEWKKLQRKGIRSAILAALPTILIALEMASK